MKKSIIALIGLFTLVACSEDVYQEADKMNETGVVDNNGSGGMQINSIDPAIPYESPYDNLQTCCSLITFDFTNNTDLDLEFSPFVGFARFDGAYDNMHFGYGGSSSAYLLNNFNYPNLIASAENGEYFQLAKCKIFTLPKFSTFNQSTGQFPVFSYFPLANPSTSQELSIIYEYGKMYSIEATIKDPANGNSIVRNNQILKFPFLPAGITDPVMLGSGDWIRLPSPSLLSPKTDDLWYNRHTLEICIGNDSASFPGGGDGINDKPSELIFDYNGQTYILKLSTTSTNIIITLDYL